MCLHISETYQVTLQCWSLNESFISIVNACTIIVAQNVTIDFHSILDKKIVRSVKCRQLFQQGLSIFVIQIQAIHLRTLKCLVAIAYG